MKPFRFTLGKWILFLAIATVFLWAVFILPSLVFQNQFAQMRFVKTASIVAGSGLAVYFVVTRLVIPNGSWKPVKSENKDNEHRDPSSGK